MKGGSSTVDQSVWPTVSVIVRKRFVNRWVRSVVHRNWCRKMYWTQTPEEIDTVVEIDLFDLLWTFSLHYTWVKLPSLLQLFWLSFFIKNMFVLFNYFEFHKSSNAWSRCSGSSIMKSRWCTPCFFAFRPQGATDAWSRCSG